MTAIEVSNISKRFRITHGKEPTLKGTLFDLFRRCNIFEDFLALEKVGFHVENGETVGIIGENGSGKSTMLSLIAGISKPSEGNIKVKGSVSTLLELGAGFHSDLTGRENVYLNGSILGFSEKEMKRRFQQIVEFAELEKFIDTPVKYYSSGMYVRLGFAIAVEVDPDILLIDEVLAVGDEHFQQKCLRKIKEFQKRGKTILFVSHALATVEELCDRVVLLHHGKIKSIGRPSDVLRTYRIMALQKNRTIRVGEWGTRKEAVITNIRILDKDRNENKDFNSLAPLCIEIDYKAHKRIDKPVFGIAIFNARGENCFGTNTQIENYPIEYIENEGKIELWIDQLTLPEGLFFFNFSLHSWNHQEQYHRIDFRHEVSVRNVRQDTGFLKLSCHWRLEK